MKQILVSLALVLLVTSGEVGTARADSASRAVTRCDPYCFNADYLFGVTRGTRDAISEPIVFLFVSPITVAVDLGLLPFEVALGLMG